MWLKGYIVWTKELKFQTINLIREVIHQLQNPMAVSYVGIFLYKIQYFKY